MAFCQSYPYRFKYLTVDEGLSHTDANDLAQDNKGYIWVATFFGLNRFDGYTIKGFYNKHDPLHNAYKNRIICIYPDATGNIWLSTEGGLQCFESRTEKYIEYSLDGNRQSPTFRKLIKGRDGFLYGIAGSRFVCYALKARTVEEHKLALPPGVRFSDMAEDGSGNLYIASNQGVWKLEKSKSLKNIAIAGCSDLNLSHIYINEAQNMLLATGNQLFLTGKTTDHVQTGSDEGKSRIVVKSFTDTAGTHLKGIKEDKRGHYWVNAGSRLLCLDGNLNLVQEISNKNALNSLNSRSINSIYIDRSQCLWVCTFGGGVNYCDLNQKQFYTFRSDAKLPSSISGDYIRSVLEDKHKLWIGTKYNGLNLYDFTSKKITFYNTYSADPRLQNDDIAALTLDDDRNLWIGSSAGIEIMKPDRRELWRPPGSEKFPAYVIETLVKDCYGNIWFGNHTDRFGVIWKDGQGKFQVKYYGEGYFIFPEKNAPELFVSSTHGLKRLFIDKEGNIVRTYTYQAGTGSNKLSSDYTYPVCKQNDSTYWIGTIGGGLNRMILRKDNSYSIKSYTSDFGVFNDVESLEVDNAGNIWIGGNGLQCLNPATGQLIRYDKNDGLQGNSFKVGSSYKGTDGRLYFGGINGLNYFYPEEIKPNLIAARPVLTDLSVSNKKIKEEQPDLSETGMDSTLSYSSSLKLDYLQNNFVISFSAMHYANPLKCRYRYKLTGYDNDWRFTDGKNPSATYNNLEYREYTFVLEATNNDGLWSPEQATVQITITPPWWKSPVAKGMYVFLFITALSGIYIYQARWYRLKRELAVRAVNENKREEIHRQREELYQQQLQFFTNISHELRTPLTLILGPLEALMKENKNSIINNSYQLMFRNVKRLINLINELMNFKKVADSVIKLQVQPLYISRFCNNLYQEFESLALSKDISFTLTDHTTADHVGGTENLFDAQILEKILFNLLHNAFKYTNVGGKVRLEVFFNRAAFVPSFETEFHLLNEQYRAKEFIYFLVADTGIGISKESISNIFDRYYRISKNHLGSGVGLALVKSLTQLHKGDISVYSERYKGTEIVVALPWGKEYSKEEMKTYKNEATLSQLELLDSSVSFSVPNHEQENHDATGKISKHILLVEDNQELRAFLKQALERFYYVHEAEDGKAALDLAVNQIPDLIISDVMMPGMNGIELCKLVKDQFETSHITFIILSAKDALDAKIEGLESGADYYFEKPLSVDLLLLTVHNIFEQAQKLKLRYTNNYLAEASELVHSEKDKDFMNKILELIEANIGEPDLDADLLCNQLFISRTKLYQKIKSISDQSVGEFIKTIRLKKAIQIMTHEDIALNKIADRIGLQSHSYFSRVFKKEFGKTPSEFMQSLKKDSNSDKVN